MHLRTFRFRVSAAGSTGFRAVPGAAALRRPGPNAARAGRAGGRGVIEGLGKQLNLDRRQVEPSFNSLYWCAPARRPPAPAPLAGLRERRWSLCWSLVSCTLRAEACTVGLYMAVMDSTQ